MICALASLVTDRTLSIPWLLMVLNVKHILQLAGEENLVDVETDSSYNNRPQPGCEAATQTFCPLVEQCTTKKLTINIETANVNCPSKNCEHNVDTCKRNYSTGES
jgi:hypothetical protein